MIIGEREREDSLRHRRCPRSIASKSSPLYFPPPSRYFAIVYPFHGLNYLKTHKVHVLLLIWLAGVLFASIQLFQTEAVAFRNGNETYYDCKELWGELEGKCFTLFVFVVTFALPVSALVFVYVSIGRHIIGRTAPGNPDSVRDSIRANIKVKVGLRQG